MEQTYDFPEKELTFLIGRIIRNWAQVEDYVLGQIGSLQMFVRARELRIPRAMYPGTQVGFTPDVLTPTNDPEQRWKQQWTQFSKLCRYLHQGGYLDKQLGDIAHKLNELYKIRNDVGHATAQLFPSDSTVTFTSAEWTNKFASNRSKPIESRDIVAREKTHSLKHLNEAADGLWLIFWELREIVAGIPIMELVPPKPPAS